MTAVLALGLQYLVWVSLEMGFLFRFWVSRNVEWQANLWTFCVSDIKRNSVLYQKKTLIQGVNTLKAEGEVSIRIVDMVEQLESLICSVYLDCSWFFFKVKLSKSFSMLLLIPLKLKIIPPMQNFGLIRIFLMIWILQYI